MNASKVIAPTVGRIVWYWDDRNRRPHGQPMAATVAHVHSDRMVNLAVTDPNGVPFPRTSVELVQEGEAPPRYGFYCEWMPYQKGQAAKAEAAEAKVKTQREWERETEALGLPVVRHHDEEQADHKALGQTGRKATWAADTEGHTTGN